MRKGLILLAAVAVLWSAAWFAAARTLERAAETWFAETAAAGMLAGYDHLAVGGWPWRLVLRVERPRVLDPVAGLGWQGDVLALGAPVWAPLRPEAVPQGRQVLWIDGAEWALQADALLGRARLSPGGGGPEGATLVLRGGLLRAPDGAVIRLDAGALRFASGAGGLDAEVALTGLEAAGLDWPGELAPRPEGPVERLEAAVVLEPAGPLPWPPARLSVRELALAWGDTQLRGAGDLDIAAEGWPEGRIAFEARDWAPLVALAAALGWVPRDVAPTWLRVLDALDEADGRPDVLEVPLIFQGGRMGFGPLPLGPAPRLRG
ncbi:MAG: DUF2125 domain-containing protein [Alkalilacustris sp.]